MKPTNRLANESSPYLLQHAHNPVNWYPWCAEALEKAKQEDKLILVSIGYSACHWCHVMEKESFEDVSTAYLMNQYFVCIKVDREERPDLDHFYMDALQAISGQGGWPLNMFLTPDGKPFYGGTYFPPQAMHQRISWKELLVQLHDAFIKRRNEIEEQANHLLDYLKKSNQVIPKKDVSFDIPTEEKFTKQQLEKIFQQLMASADTHEGGFGNAPKFPQTYSIQFLLRYYHFFGDPTALNHAILSLKKMMRGGIYDHVGGGFCRYSTDAQWKVPHFEKMAYDNALLLMVLTETFQITKDDEIKRVIYETVDFLIREMLGAEGGFYAALDADSEGVEGKFYVWSKEEFEAVVGEYSKTLCDYFNIKEDGNWEHVNILFTSQSIIEWANEQGISEAKAIGILSGVKKKLLNARESRIRPGLDDKIILGWNALLSNALFQAALVFNESSWMEVAEKNTQFLIKEFFDEFNHQWKHTYKNKVVKFPAFLDDLAYFIQLLLTAHQATASLSYLHQAKEIAEYVIEHFSDDENTYFYFTPDFHHDIMVRKIDLYDGATPSGNSIMAYNLMSLGIMFDQKAWKERAHKMLEGLETTLLRYPTSFGKWGNLFIELHKGIGELAVLGIDALVVSKGIYADFLPNKVVVISDKSNDTIPLLIGRSAEENTKFFVCRDFACLAPVGEAQEAIRLLLTISDQD